MTAQVISLEAYRLKRQPPPRLADQETEDEKEKAFDDKLKRRFYLELDTWPQVFQQRIRTQLEYNLEQDPDRHKLYKLLGDRKRVKDGNLELPAKWLHFHGSRIIRAASKVREAKARGMRQYAIKRREQWLARMKDDLLYLLWEMGWQKVDRKAFAEMAEKELPKERESLVQTIKNLKYWVALEEPRIRAGVYIRGPKKGRPYSEARLKSIKQNYERYKSELARQQQRIAEIDSAPTVLRAWGFHFSREER